jgi:hypothetical protein
MSTKILAACLLSVALALPSEAQQSSQSGGPGGQSGSAGAQGVVFRVSPSVPPAVGEDIQKLFWECLKFLSGDTGLSLTRPVTVYVYGWQREIYEGLLNELEVSEGQARRVAAEAPFFVVGERIFINAGTPLFLDAPQREARARVIAHELTHILHNDLMGGARPAAQWIKEGFAVREEMRAVEHLGFRPAAQTSLERVNLTAFGFRRQELIPFADLVAGTGWEARAAREGPDRIYAQAFVAVEYLVRTKGQPALLAYFRAFQTSEDPDVNFVNAFGLDSDAFQHEFERHVASLAP